MKIHFALGAIVLSLLPLQLPAQKETAHHREVYAEINRSLDSCRYIRAELHDDHAEVKVEGWFDGQTPRKIVVTFLGEHGAGIEEYYLEDGRPLFVFSKFNTVEMETGKVVAVMEDRFYFKGGEMFKWLDHEKKQVAPDSVDFKDRAEALKTDCARYLSALRGKQNSTGVKREPTDGEIAAYGAVTKVEDSGYPMLTVSLKVGKDQEKVDFFLNAESVGVSEAALRELIGKQIVRFFYTYDDRNELQDIRVGGESLLGEHAPELEPKWKKITGILSGADTESGDLPGQVTVIDDHGNKVNLSVFITPEMTNANGKTVTVYYAESSRAIITYIDLSIA